MHQNTRAGTPSAEAEPTGTDMSEDPRDLGEDLSLTEEMLLEEVSIDGMCGVY
jgi:mycofactocin precursor